MTDVKKPLVTEYLKSRSFDDLSKEHGVNASGVERQGDGKFVLNYDQFEAKKGDTLAEQCRGLVIRVVNTNNLTSDRIVGAVKLLAWPMDRFYDYTDPAAAKIDWSDPLLRVCEKLDGTMIVLYWDTDLVHWCIATRNVPEADVSIRVGHLVYGDKTFSQLFCETFESTCDDLDKNVTYVFELTSPLNRIIVKYDKPRVTLIAARNILTGEEQDTRGLCHLTGVTLPQRWQIGGIVGTPS